MLITLIFLFCVFLLLCAYFIYGKRIERDLVKNPDMRMPSVDKQDGVDYVPTPTPVLFGHHFSSIAGAGPIVGPILVASAFGWLPTLLWILIGSVFIGAVHDYTATLASVNNGGASIGAICRKYLSRSAYVIMLLFLLFTLSYVIIVFLDLTASTLTPQEGVGEFSSNGAVATISVLYIVLALVYGLTVYKFRIDFKKASFIFVPLVFIAMLAGWYFPIDGAVFEKISITPKTFWLLVLLVYCFIASVLPVWLLLQPRDYLSAFLLYACIIVGFSGVVISGILGKISIENAAFKGFFDPSLGYLYPAVFINVACGAVSGFHALVSSGTTAKQIKEKKNILPVVYGSMLVEAALAILALITVIIVVKIPQGQAATQTFANGIGTFASACGLPKNFGVVFALLALNTFLLTTLDTCTRLTRFILEELFSFKFRMNRFLSTALVLIFPAFMCFVRIHDQPAWKLVWPAFGTTNQLLAAVTLLIVSLWLLNEGRKVYYTLIPMIFMLITTSVSLISLCVKKLGSGDYIIGVISLLTLLMTIYIVLEAMFALKRAFNNKICS